MSTESIAAVKTGDAVALQRLLATGADVNARDEAGSTLLMLAAHAGDLDMVRLLLGSGSAKAATSSPTAKAPPTPIHAPAIVDGMSSSRRRRYRRSPRKLVSNSSPSPLAR